MTTAMLQNRT